MKMKLVAIILLIVGASIGISKSKDIAEEYLRAKFISVENAEKKWGIKPFDKQEFRKSDSPSRHSMAVEVIKKQIYVGQDISKVRDELGDPDGYFFSDTILAYQIARYSKENHESWQLVFIPDKSIEKVAAVKIHKKCCYR